MPSLFFLIPFYLFLSQSLAVSFVSSEFDCDAHIPNPAKCLPALTSNPTAYEICKQSICYLFLEESPFVILNEDCFEKKLLSPYKPFKCGQPSELDCSLRGIAFHLHNETSSRDATCIWAGPLENCSFNALVDFTAVHAENGYQFAISGLLLETPQRQCVHQPSAPFVDNRMVIIGKNLEDNAASKGPLHQLVSPFRGATWGIFAAVVLMFILVCFAIAVRFHVFRGRSLVTAFFIFAGERDQAMAYEYSVSRIGTASGQSSSHAVVGTTPNTSAGANHQKNTRRKPWDLRRRHSTKTPTRPIQDIDIEAAQQRNMSFATKYGLSMTLFRISLLAFVAVFALFYEVAVVNFVFQQSILEIGKSVKNLSAKELEKYVVLKNSALENVWSATVNPRQLPYDNLSDGQEVPWNHCDTGTECIEKVAESDTIDFDVTFEILGQYHVKQNNLCKKLTIFETKDILYHFNAGWLYNSQCNQALKKKIDRELIALRIDGTIRQLIEDEIGDVSSCSVSPRADIGPFIILVPCIIFVFPPLFAALLVLFFWKDEQGLVDNKTSVGGGNDSSATSDMEQGDSGDTLQDTVDETNASRARLGGHGEREQGNGSSESIVDVV